MNRNILKIIAVISMLIDHIGAFIFQNLNWLRLIGRLAFPIFAFFIAEGLKHTSNKRKYIVTLLIFAIISQIPYFLLKEWFKLNILFTFLTAILIIYLIETINRNFLLKTTSLTSIFVVLLLLELFSVIDYGIIGIILIMVFYFSKDKKTSLLYGAITLLVLSLYNAYLGNFTLYSFNQFIGLLSIPILSLYNNEKGKVNLKYLFYIFYPLHLLIIYIITLYV